MSIITSSPSPNLSVSLSVSLLARLFNICMFRCVCVLVCVCAFSTRPVHAGSTFAESPRCCEALALLPQLCLSLTVSAPTKQCVDEVMKQKLVGRGREGERGRDVGVCV